MYVVCVNEPCENHGIVVPLTVTLAEGESVRCGGWTAAGDPCGQLCEVHDGEPETKPA